MNRKRRHLGAIVQLFATPALTRNLRTTIKLYEACCQRKLFNKFIHPTDITCSLRATKEAPFESHSFIYQSDTQSNNTIKLLFRKILENNSPFKFRRVGLQSGANKDSSEVITERCGVLCPGKRLGGYETPTSGTLKEAFVSPLLVLC